MRFQFSFRHMKSSEALQANFERKMSGALAAMIHESSPVRVTFIVENGLHKVHVEMQARNHSLIELGEESEDMNKSIDLLVDKVHALLNRSKERQLDHHRARDVRVPTAAPSTPAGEDVELEEWIDENRASAWQPG